MNCTVLLFAHAREIAGCDRLTLTLHDGATVRDALAAIEQAHPALAELRHRLAIAVNERYATPDSILCDGCTIALIPPVSGG